MEGQSYCKAFWFDDCGSWVGVAKNGEDRRGSYPSIDVIQHMLLRVVYDSMATFIVFN